MGIQTMELYIKFTVFALLVTTAMGSYVLEVSGWRGTRMQFSTPDHSLNDDDNGNGNRFTATIDASLIYPLSGHFKYTFTFTKQDDKKRPWVVEHQWGLVVTGNGEEWRFAMVNEYANIASNICWLCTSGPTTADVRWLGCLRVPLGNWRPGFYTTIKKESWLSC